MAVRITAGAASAQIEIRRPAWKDMQKNYPGVEVTTLTLYDEMIGGQFKGLSKLPAYENTCAVRMSYALNRSGLKLARHPDKGASIQGADGYWYWIRVANLKPLLFDRFKGADEELRLPVISPNMVSDTAAMQAVFKERVRLGTEWLSSRLNGRNGIVVFRVTGWGDASGHFTLWDGSTQKLAFAEHHDDPSSNEYYFWFTRMVVDANGNKKLAQLESVTFWELK